MFQRKSTPQNYKHSTGGLVQIVSTVLGLQLDNIGNIGCHSQGTLLCPINAAADTAAGRRRCGDSCSCCSCGAVDEITV